MKLLILLLLAGKLLTVTPPQSVAAPNEIGVVAQMQSDQTTFVYAHSNLSGTLFYDLKVGDIVTAFYSDHTVRDFEVKRIGKYAARSTETAKGGGDFDLRVGDQWMRLTEVMAMYSNLTLTTCYAADKGFGIVTGRLFVELAPVAEDER